MTSEIISKGLAELGIKATGEQLLQFDQMLQTLTIWNQKHNLTRLKSQRDQEIYHVLDSLSAHQYFLGHQEVLDIGTGAGFPGIPLAIIFPDKSFHLVESNDKKIAYLRCVVQQLGLKNIHIYNRRIELFSTSKGPYDAITARALATPSDILEWTTHLGISSYILYVGPNCKVPPGGVVQPVKVPFSEKQHFILCIDQSL
ncbi:MAG: 16S rRNA (guanine(527)-N(7))-methyltransferase RsmG [Pseudomonadota bacterium]|nr:16S rRNA (guanine(527)-N(7))-methyltransferase RsmG [Pseudomonadota bacterium]